jgi:hypothetical protein
VIEGLKNADLTREKNLHKRWRFSISHFQLPPFPPAALVFVYSTHHHPTSVSVESFPPGAMHICLSHRHWLYVQQQTFTTSYWSHPPRHPPHTLPIYTKRIQKRRVPRSISEYYHQTVIYPQPAFPAQFSCGKVEPRPDLLSISTCPSAHSPFFTCITIDSARCPKLGTQGTRGPGKRSPVRTEPIRAGGRRLHYIAC